MSDRIFHVGAERNHLLTGYVPAKFLMRNGMYVMDPTPGGSQKSYLYSDGLGNNKTDGSVANPNNYLIVPANYSEQQAKNFAAEIADSRGRSVRDETGGAMGLNQALANMAAAFVQGGSQDLQRHPQWGIPKGSVVPAFVGSASNHLGYVTALGGLPKLFAEIGGGLVNEWHHRSDPTIDNSGRYWLSQQNQANVSQGFADGLAASKPPSPFNDYGYGPQAQRGVGQIGDGNGLGGLFASVAGIDPSNPTQPVPPQTGGVLGLPSSQPAQYPNQVSGNKPQASVFDSGAPPVRFVSRNTAPPNLTQPALPSQSGGVPGISSAEPVRYLSRRGGNNSPAPTSDAGAPAALFALPDSLKFPGDIANWLAGLAGVDPQNPTQAAAPPQDDQLRSFYRDDPVQPWTLQSRR